MNATPQTHSALHLLEHRIPPPILVILLGFVMGTVAHYTPALVIDGNYRVALGVLFAVAGLSLLVSGFRAFQRAETTIDPVRIDAASSVVTGGIFAYTRNPMYVGFTALLVGWTFYLANPWALLGPLFFVLFITRFQIIPEERVMSSKFGSAYNEYRRRVRRWL